MKNIKPGDNNSYYYYWLKAFKNTVENSYSLYIDLNFPVFLSTFPINLLLLIFYYLWRCQVVIYLFIQFYIYLISLNPTFQGMKTWWTTKLWWSRRSTRKSGCITWNLALAWNYSKSPKQVPQTWFIAISLHPMSGFILQWYSAKPQSTVFTASSFLDWSRRSGWC